MKLLTVALTIVATSALAAPPGLRLPDYESETLASGAQILVVPHREVPLVSYNLLLRGGTLTDPPGKEGLTALTVELLRKGAGDRSATDIASLLDSYGMSLNTNADLTGTAIALDCLAADAPLALAVLTDLVLRPTFPKDEVDKLKTRVIDGLKAAKEQPQSVIPLYFARALFGDHAYGRPTTGTEATVASITADDVAAHWKQLLAGDRLIAAIGGDVPEGAGKSLAAGFGGIARGATPVPNPAPAPRATTRRVLLVDMPDAVQTYFWIGDVGISQSFSADAAFDVVRTAFGGRFTSMLNTELRIKTGLTYGARLTLEQLEGPGRLAITSFTATEKTKEALDLALATLAALKTKYLDATVVSSSKAYIAGQVPTTLETAHAMTQAIVDLHRFGQPKSQLTEYFTRLDAVTPATTRAVIDSDFPDPSRVVIVLIGKASEIAAIAATYGPVETKTLADPGF